MNGNIDPNHSLAREAVGIFDERLALEASIDELLSAGFDRSELSLLAHESALEEKLGYRRATAAELADDPNAPRTDYFCTEALGGAEGALIGAFTYVPAVGAVMLTSASGATVAALTATALATGGVGALIGAGLAFWLARHRAHDVLAQIDRGGIVLWVRTVTPEKEVRAVRILAGHSAHDVHVHGLDVVPESAAQR